MLVDTILGAEFHIFVEHGVVILPCAVALLCCLHHWVKEVVCLLAPWLIEKDCCDNTLTCTAKGSKVWTQSLEVRVTPALNAIVTAYGIWLLPEIKMEFLIGNCGQ